MYVMKAGHNRYLNSRVYEWAEVDADVLPSEANPRGTCFIKSKPIEAADRGCRGVDWQKIYARSLPARLKEQAGFQD
jgi:hypothetical protein